MNIQSPVAGQATTAGASSLTDTNQSWQTDIWSGYVVYIVAGTGSGQAVTITSNDSSTLTIQGSWVTEPDHSSFYEIRAPRPPPSHVNLFRASNMVVNGSTTSPYPYTHDGTSPVLPFDGTLEIDVTSTTAQSVEMAFGTGAGSAQSYVFTLSANVYQHIQLELKEGDAVELYFNTAATVALCLGAKQ